MVIWTEEQYLNYLGKRAPKKNKYRNIKTTVDGIAKMEIIENRYVYVVMKEGRNGY